jgi:hypothetical protein
LALAGATPFAFVPLTAFCVHELLDLSVLSPPDPRASMVLLLPRESSGEPHDPQGS